ncbi:MAG: tetratricopeptide repeat protein [Planctomycetota bacterium]|jgi:tetratricopeptide (TPR) repeat protein
MASEPPTYRKLIQNAFKVHDGNFTGFVKAIMDTIKTGLPEMQLVAVKEVLEKETDKVKTIWLRLLLGTIYLRKRDFDLIQPLTAGIYEDESLDKVLRAYACHLESRILSDTGRTDEAINMCIKGLALYEGDEELTAAHLTNTLGITCMSMGRDEDALDYFERTAEILEKYYEGNVPGGVYNNIAIMHTALGNSDEAIAAYRKALESENDPANAALTTSNIAALMLAEGHAGQALEYSNRALDTLKNVEDNVVRTTVLACRTEILLELGEFDEALEIGKSALIIGRSIKNVVLQLEAELLYAAALAELGDDEAHVQLERALKLQDESENVKRAESYERALISCGKMLCEKNDTRGYAYLKQARETIQQCIQTPMIKGMRKKLDNIIEALPSELKRLISG